jgi:hypothetical protein
MAVGLLAIWLVGLAAIAFRSLRWTLCVVVFAAGMLSLLTLTGWRRAPLGKSNG